VSNEAKMGSLFKVDHSAKTGEAVSPGKKRKNTKNIFEK
jgi:hypothetical protein